MKKKNERKPLTGTDQEKARQLVDLMKKEKFTGEELKEILPHSIVFYKELTNCLKTFIDQVETTDRKFIDTMNNLLNNIAQLLSDNKITEAERLKLIDIIATINEQLYNFMDNKSRRRLIGILALLGTVVAIIRKGGNRS